MSGYDGEIRINTNIYTKSATSQLMSLQNRMEKTARKIETLNEKIKELEAPNVKTDAFANLETSLEKAKEKLASLRKEQEKWESTGITSGGAWDSLCEKMALAEEEIFSISSEMEKMKASGAAFTNQIDTDEYKKAKLDLVELNNEMELLKVKEKEVYAKQSQINAKGFDKFAQSARKGSASVKKLASQSANANKKFSNLFRTMKSMILSMVVFQVFSKSIEFLKSGLQNLAVYSKEYNKSMSGLISSTSQLKNSFAVAFEPILNMVIPMLSKLVDWISAAANAVSRFFAILSGKSTYTKAIKQNKDYAASLDKVGSSADEAKGSLAGYDELEVMQKKDSGGNSNGADGSGFVEETIGDTSKFENIKRILGEIADIFKSGFAKGLGDWESQISDIKEKTQLIKDALKNIFTDPAVVSGASTFGQALLYNLGVVAGSVVSVGLTIAQNLLGGIATYLTENAERIKQYIVNMFDIGTDIVDLVGGFAKAFAYVFESFGSENGQQLTANLIGMFTSAFMGVTQLCWSLARDLLNIIIQPFVENKDGFRAALNGFFGVAATVCGTIKSTIENTFDKLFQIYDEHIKPFFDSIASGFSELSGKFMEFWNTNVQPVLNSLVEKFDEVMLQHIQPMLDKAVELIGSVVDAIKVFWEQVLQPMIAWVIDNVLPVLLPIFEGLYKGVMDCIGFIADAIGGMIDTVKGIIDFLVGVFTGDWDKAWNAVSDIVKGVFETISSKINLALTAIRTIVNTILQAVLGTFKTKFTAIHDFIYWILEKVGSIISGALGSINKSWESGWNKAKATVINVFENIWSGIKKVINTILGGIEKLVNGVIGGLNFMIGALNKLSFDVPDWVPEIGGKTFGFDISEIQTVNIPRLANGGITTGSTLANIGEAGREAVLPLERNTGWMDMLAETLADKVNSSGAQTINLSIELDGSTVYKRMVQLDREFAGRTGSSGFSYGY